MESNAPVARLQLALTDPLRVLHASGEVRNLLGYSAEELTAGRGALRERLHSEDREQAASIFSAESAGGGRSVLRFRHADGRIRCLLAESMKQRETIEGAVAVTLELRDVRSCADAMLLPALACFRSLMEGIDDIMYLKDRYGVFRAVTSGLLGMSAEIGGGADFEGRTVYDVFPEELADTFYRLDSQAVRDGRPRHGIQRLATRSGGTRWIDDHRYPLRNPDGEVVGIYGICPNITEPLEAERRLRESHDLFQLFVEYAPAALAMFDREMRYMAVSRRWRLDCGLGEREIIGRSHYEVFPDVPEHWKQKHRRALAGETLRSDEDRFARADGRVQWMRWDLRPWLTAEGGIGGILLFAEDITKQRRDREQLQLAASVFTKAREGILICDPAGTILDVNETFTRITGYSREEAVGRNPRMLKSGRQGEEFYRDLWRALRENGQWSGEMWNRAKDGRIYPEMLTISAVYDSAGQVLHYVGLFSDITEAKEHEQLLTRVTYYDALTNLPNRTLLADRLEQAIAHSHRRRQTLAVACLDLDGFRRVNERCGHDAGDQMLANVSRSMLKVVREGDTLARIGGNKFAAVLLDAGDPGQARQLLDRLLEAAREDSPCESGDGPVSGSMGVAFYADGEEDMDAGRLLRQAESALYQAKLAGKGRCRIYDPGQDALTRIHENDLAAIRHAFDAREFVMYYQPCVNMSTGSLVSVEALVRWQHPERGLLPPSMFLPAIENHELMDRMGEWGLETAMTQMEAWRDAGLEAPASVNVAARCLQHPEFVERLRALFQRHPRVRPQWLELEVLETSALHNLAEVSNALEQCRELGVSVALDDFGTGYSSLTWLRRLPVNILKIDQSFVREMLDNPEDLTILEGVLGLSAAFDRMAVAEGVETVEHGTLLLQLGCVYGQGYGIARPMPPEQLPAWHAGWKPDPVWGSASSAGPEQRRLLHAAVGHRAWAAGLEAFLKGERSVPPAPDPHRCRLGVWLERETQRHGRRAMDLDAAERLHRRIHAFANRLSGPEWKGLGVDARVNQLRRLSESLTETVHRLMQTAPV